LVFLDNQINAGLQPEPLPSGQLSRTAIMKKKVSIHPIMIQKRFFFPVLIGCLLTFSASAQGYQALHGSAFTGSTAYFNNPASPVNSAYPWDLTLLSAQVKIRSNFLYLKNFTLSDQSNSSLSAKEGFTSKFLHSNMDLSLFNFLYKIDQKHALNIGFRMRSYTHSKAEPFVLTDSINRIHDFFIANRSTPNLQGYGTHAGWIEADLNYSAIIKENDHSRLSAGVTLQIMKGLSGAFFKLNKLSYLEAKTATDTAYYFSGGNGSFGYSANYDENSFKNFMSKSKNGLGLSMGIEYLTYQTDRNDGKPNNALNYDWKLGASLMDLGGNIFAPSPNSGAFFTPDPTISDAKVDQKLSGANSASAFRDSLNSLFTTSSLLTDNFNISNPTRLILNADKHLGNHFYINGELSMNFYSTASYTKYRTRELNLLTLTPRWETLAWGLYLPVQYNTQGQTWVGLAIKAGPLVLGFHNLGLLKKDPTINGGGYLLLSVHPFSTRKVLSKFDCPE
jgi:hypothetical protein